LNALISKYTRNNPVAACVVFRMENQAKKIIVILIKTVEGQMILLLWKK
jgi:hypothetical protein